MKKVVIGTAVFVFLFFACAMYGAEAHRRPHRPTGNEPKTFSIPANDATTFFLMGHLGWDVSAGLFRGQRASDEIQYGTWGEGSCFDSCDHVPGAPIYPETGGAYNKIVELEPEESFWMEMHPECRSAYALIKSPNLAAIEYGCVTDGADGKGLQLLFESFSGGENLHNYFVRAFGLEHRTAPYGSVAGFLWLPRQVSGARENRSYHVAENRLICPRRATRENPVSLDELIPHAGAPLPADHTASDWSANFEMIYFDISTPEARRRSIAEMRRSGLVPRVLSDDEVIPVEWYTTMVRDAVMPPDSKIELYVKQDRLAPSVWESYWFGRIVHPDHDGDIFGLGLIRFGQTFRNNRRPPWKHGVFLSVKEIREENGIENPLVIPPRLCE